MPCTSDYPEATPRNRHLRHTALLYRWVLRTLGVASRTEVRPSYRLARVAAKDTYCNDDFTPPLCRLMNGMTERVKKTLFQHEHPNGQRLALWWKRHQAADAKRMKEERVQRKLAKVRKQALAKLSKIERRALGIKEKA